MNKICKKALLISSITEKENIIAELENLVDDDKDNINYLIDICNYSSLKTTTTTEIFHAKECYIYVYFSNINDENSFVVLLLNPYRDRLISKWEIKAKDDLTEKIFNIISVRSIHNFPKLFLYDIINIVINDLRLKCTHVEIGKQWAFDEFNRKIYIDYNVK